MNSICITLGEKDRVFGNSGELFQGLLNQVESTKPFIESLQEFFIKFNDKYNTEVTLEKLLDTYNDENDLDLKENIILCKALLDFIKSNGIQISFSDKSCLLEYATLASINAILKYNPLKEDEKNLLEKLSISISLFIQKVRGCFKMIIKDSVDLEQASVDDHFNNIIGINTCDKTIQVEEIQAEEIENQDLNSDFIEICEGLNIKFSTQNHHLIHKISNLDNKTLILFFDYLFEIIPDDEKSGEKYVDITNLLFDELTPDLLKNIREVFEEGKILIDGVVTKINIDKLKSFLRKNSKSIIELQDNSNDNELVNNEEDSIKLLGNILQFASGEELNLESDKKFIEDLLNLSAENIRKLFGYLENIVKKRYNLADQKVAKRLASIIQSSENRNSNVAQKISNLRSKEAKIRQKFLDNNINIYNFRKFILSSFGTSSGSKPNNQIKRRKKNFNFEFINEQTNKRNSINVELNGKKGIEGFIYSLNSLIAQEIENIDLKGCIKPFTIENFVGIDLDTAFFDNINRLLEDNNILDMFEIFDQAVLEKFLLEWHKKMNTKLNTPKEVYIKPGSREELFDFVFNVWQKALFKKVNKEARKSRKKTGDMSIRRDVVRLTEEMFAGVNKLTPDLLSQLDISLFNNTVFSRISKAEVEKMILEYLEKRKNLHKN